MPPRKNKYKLFYLFHKQIKYCRQQTSYGAFLVLTASFSLNTGITFNANSDFTVSVSCFLKSLSRKSLSVTRSWAEVTSSWNREMKIKITAHAVQENECSTKVRCSSLNDFTVILGINLSFSHTQGLLRKMQNIANVIL